MSAPAMQRQAAESLEIGGGKLRIALSGPTDSASRHDSHKDVLAASNGRGIADGMGASPRQRDSSGGSA
jgi:hypothetical protein